MAPTEALKITQLSRDPVLIFAAVAFLSFVGFGEQTTICRDRSMNHVTWKFDNLRSIGGHKVQVLGSPKIIDTHKGKALEFDGVQDGLLIEAHPIQGYTEFTVEVIFRPDANGLKEQRFFHLQETGSEDRVLLETRLTDDGNWFLDTFIKSGKTDQTQYAEIFLHLIGPWYHAALTFDGKEMRHYVNGVLELSSPITFAPARRGQTSVGVRINKVFWFKGAIREARFTTHALKPDEFLQP